MKKTNLLFLFLLCTSLAWAQTPLTIDKIMQNPAQWIGTSPSAVEWSADSKTVYFRWNPEKNKADSLYKINVNSPNSIQKVTNKEDQSRVSSSVVYNKDGSLAVFSKVGDLFLLYPKTQQIRRLTQTVDNEANPRFSADEQSVFFTKQANVFQLEITTGLVKQITDFQTGSKPKDKKKGEQAAWLEQDQLALFDILKERKEKQDATEAYQKNNQPKGPKKIYLDGKRIQNATISPDGSFVTYTLVENPKEAQNTIVPNYVTQSGYTTDIPARTKVGSPLPTYTSFVYDIARDTVWTIRTNKLPGILEKPAYLAEYGDTARLFKTPREVVISDFSWSPLGTFAVGIVRSQDNKDRWIVRLNPKTGDITSLDRQRDEAWIAGPGIGWSMGGATFGWIDENTCYFQSEESGYSHLYTMNVATGEKKAITSGKFEVQTVELSKDKKFFYLTTNEVHPGQKHFYKMSVEGGAREQLTTGVGGNDVSLSPDEKWMAILYSETNKPWELFLAPVANPSQRVQVTSSLTDEFKKYPWRAAKVITFKAQDGQDVYARIYEPASKVKNKKAVVFVHGAGYLQNAHYWWSSYFREYMFHNLLVDKGYTVLDIDYRASAGYGRDWRTGIYRHMGGKDLTDQVDGVNYLVKNHGIDPKKVGIYGGSYGGFITLMGLFTTPDVFKAGAALRPVTDWAAYNHGYTANILNEPHTDSLAYRRSSPIYHAAGLKNNLLMCHGVVDVNVHYQDVVRLSQKLIELRKENWELASYPMEDHGFVEPSSWADEYKRILKLFEEKLR